MDTTMLIKTKKDLKVQAQNLAREMGLPLSTLVNNYLRNFIIERQVVFNAPMPNKKTQAIIDAARKEYKVGKSFGPFYSAEEMIKSLNS
ncbi:MAG: type II toxin-antitoxin system RelB/DinJ family antitoxin [Minisyncoccia bacterium]